MSFQIKSIRTFIGAKDYNLSRDFYKDFGFEEIIISAKMSYFHSGDFGFYLQDYYTKDWINNSMIFLEVTNLTQHYEAVKALGLEEKYKIRITEIHFNDWGDEFFVYDPSGVLWHIGSFH